MNEMLWNKLSSIAEIVSSIAILGTLGYLAIQTRQNTEAIQAQIRSDILTNDITQIQKFIDYPLLGRMNPRTEDEKIQSTAHILTLVRTRENHWVQYQNGVLDRETWESYRGALRTVVFGNAYGVAVWDAYLATGSFNPGFIRDVETWRQEQQFPLLEEILPTPDL